MYEKRGVERKSGKHPRHVADWEISNAMMDHAVRSIRARAHLERGYDIPLRAANRQEAETFALLFDTQDRAEGMRAFLEKRPAKFVGK